METWIQTSKGKVFRPLDPDPESIDIEEIARCLSKLCRFTGHCRGFYSVAEHSILVSKAVPIKQALWGLLHDAEEAYIGDMPGPIKRCCSWFENLDEGVTHAVAKRFGLSWPMPSEVKEADVRLLATERDHVMCTNPPQTWGLVDVVPYTPKELGFRSRMKIGVMSPRVAERKFLERFHECS